MKEMRKEKIESKEFSMTIANILHFAETHHHENLTDMILDAVNNYYGLLKEKEFFDCARLAAEKCVNKTDLNAVKHFTSLDGFGSDLDEVAKTLAILAHYAVDYPAITNDVIDLTKQIANVNTAVFCSAIKHKLSISVAQEVLK